MNDFIWSLMTTFLTNIGTVSTFILTSGYDFFEYVSTTMFSIISEIYHISMRLSGPGWSSDFLRLFQQGNRVEVTTRLNTWQYWWWFWFCFGWAYYDGFFKRILCSRNFRVFIGIYTSVRPHGKFGDFIACIIPAGWVINIVFNSNSLLKLAEWQNDTTIFNIRVRARQWYWLYYYDFKHIFDLFTLPKQIGWNSWRCDGFGISKYYSSYLNALEGRSRDFSNAFEYWDEKVTEIVKGNYLKKQRPKTFANSLLNQNTESVLSQTNDLNSGIAAKATRKKLNIETTTNYEYVSSQSSTDSVLENKDFYSKSLISSELNRKLQEYQNNTLGLQDLVMDETNLSDIKKKPRKLIYDSLSSDSLDSYYFDGQKSNKKLIRIKLNLENSELKFITKLNPNNNLNLEWWDNRGLTLLLQKRLDSPDLVPADFLRSTQKIDYRRSAIEGTRCFIDTSSNSYVRDAKFLRTTSLDLIEHNKFTRNSINPSYHLPTQFSKRLLRVTKTLVLPTLTSLNVLTNSYDVVHSWFIPGLGIKFDCVPGKSTHHLLYIEYAGFFYGQCAEICGRYHHHMPIRIYACTLNYFIAWWSHIGFFKAISLNPYTEFKGTSSESIDNLSVHEEPTWNPTRSSYIW